MINFREDIPELERGLSVTPDIEPGSKLEKRQHPDCRGNYDHSRRYGPVSGTQRNLVRVNGNFWR